MRLPKHPVPMTTVFRHCLLANYAIMPEALAAVLPAPLTLGTGPLRALPGGCAFPDLAGAKEHLVDLFTAYHPQDGQQVSRCSRAQATTSRH